MKNKNENHLTLGRLSGVCAKLEPASSKSNEILEVNKSVLQKFTSHALYVTCENLRRLTRFFWQFLRVKNRLLLKFEECSCVKPTHRKKKRFLWENRSVSLPLLVNFCKPETNCLCGNHRQK